MNKQYETTQGEIKDDIDKTVAIFFKQFLNKFDSKSYIKHIDFNNQLKIADLLLKVYQYRYEKFKGKLNTVSDIFSTNYDETKNLILLSEKLEVLDAKISHIEGNLHLLSGRADSIYNRLINK
jgi:hypothetical protein